MRDERLYLRPDVQVEPLVDQWYAWPHLIPPATAARNITDRHMKIMDSYISAPRVHDAAVKNPKMLGGPFIDYGGARVDDIKALRDRTKAARAPLFALSDALKQLQQLLSTSATGYSLHPLYPQVPDLLRGFVELRYDLRSQPSFRVLESLLYRSSFFDSSAQSLMLSITTGDDRPFVLSTPRLEGDGLWHLHWRFDDPRIDQLFALTRTPQSWSAIVDAFQIDEAEWPQLRALLTSAPPAPYQRYDGAGLRWRYFGHACILIETRHLSILLDPVLSYTYESDISRYTYADLPDRVDFALITHNHQDHVLFETLLQLRHRIDTIVVPRGGDGALQDPSLRLTLQQIGFDRVVELGEMETLDFEDGEIRALPFFGEHADLAIATKAAYMVRLGDTRLVCAADACNVEPRLYKRVHDEIGDIDVLFLGMECDGAPLSWLYGPLLLEPIERGMDHSRRLSGSDFAQAVAMVDDLRCRQVYVYAMGQEPWLNHVMSIKYTDESRPIVESNKLIQECERRGIVAERLFGEKEILIEPAMT
jgi:L-ascorbate metabolism protein UlaG (beta-lactamase superfamily)